MFEETATGKPGSHILVTSCDFQARHKKARQVVGSRSVPTVGGRAVQTTSVLGENVTFGHTLEIGRIPRV